MNLDINNNFQANDSIIALIENVEDYATRKECIECLNNIDFKNEIIFKSLENILISDENNDIKYVAAKVIKNKYLNLALNPFLWTCEHCTCYKCLILIIRSLGVLDDENVKSFLINKIKKLQIENHVKFADSLITQDELELCSNHHLSEILINLLTIDSLNKKFEHLDYKLQQGLVTELDFSHVNTTIIDWKEREVIQDHSDLLGIKNLKSLKKLKLFPEDLVLKNEFIFECLLSILKAVEKLQNHFSKEILIFEINRIYGSKVSEVLNDVLEHYLTIFNVPIPILADIIRNYYSILFLKNKFPKIHYIMKNGQVRKIELINAKIITFPDFIIKNLTYLSHLTLKNCNLYKLPESLNLSKHLKVLNIEGNKVEILPKCLFELRSLKILNLKKNNLIKLPIIINKLKNLTYLNLASNKLTSVPYSIGSLVKLRVLDLYSNKLNKIPGSIIFLHKLKILNLGANKLIGLSKQFGFISSLSRLNLSHNYLKSIPKSFKHLKSLRVLNLEGNLLTSLPRSLKQLKRLEYLNLNDNRLAHFSLSAESFISLKFLDISCNNLIWIPKSIKRLSNLKRLDLSQNKIIAFSESFFALKSLEVLILFDNQISSIPNSIEKMNNLIKFDISFNLIN